MTNKKSKLSEQEQKMGNFLIPKRDETNSPTLGQVKQENKIVETTEKRICPRGRTFEGIVKKKFHKRVVIEFERMIYVKKYERYAKSRTRIHARVPESMEKEINIGDLIKVQECRPLSKMIHFIVIKKLKGIEESK